jgi:aminoglycoside phosphotransferase (APT) family kinase protein
VTQDEPQIDGYEVGAVEAWMTDQLPQLRRPFNWTQLEGGHSNVTCVIEDAEGRKVVVRRPPLGELQPRAHDMGREFKVISALWPTAVPVANPYAMCSNPDVTGAAFYLMGYVTGHTGATAWLNTEDQRRIASESFIDTLADIHLLDVEEIGLGDLAPKQGYIARQLRSWYRSWTTSSKASGLDDPRIHTIHEWLAEHEPPEPSPRLVHGDYGFHNLIVGDNARVAAVVDWEVCTLGDALSDLAYIINRWFPEGAPAGWFTHDEIVARYRHRTGADLSQLEYYIAFNYWRSSCILQGVYTRYSRSQKKPTGDFSTFRDSCMQRLSNAAQTVAGLQS